MTLQPHDFGLPEQFDAFRPVQIEALDMLSRSPKRVKALSVPTGGGKSLIGMADALRSRKPTCYVTDSRALQDQISETFRPVGVVDLRGRANYPCGLREDYTCEDGQSARCPDKGTVHCPSTQAEMRAAASSLVVTNYSKWIHTRKFGQGLSHIQRVIFDEGHETFNALAKAMQVTLHWREVHEVLKMDFPKHEEAEFFETWKIWAVLAREKCNLLGQEARMKVQGHQDAKSTWVKRYTHLRNLSRRLATLASANVTNWVVDELPRAYQFDPIQPARYAESALLLKVPDILIMSATLRPKTLFMVGIGADHFDYKEFPSDFDPKRCPIYYVPTMRVDAKAHDLSALWIRLDQIAAPRQDRNGLVQTISYARRDEILATSRFANSMYINDRGEPPTEVIEAFKLGYPGKILVSPSIGQGFDFARQAAEWQLICKVPFPPPSKVLKARTDVDPEHPYHLAMQKLVQMAGRIMRDRGDQGETFLCDDHFQWFLPRYRHLAPKWFNSFVRQVSVLPQPPHKLTA